MGENVLLSASHDKTVRMWSVAKGSCLAVIDHPAPVMCCTLEVRCVPTCLFCVCVGIVCLLHLFKFVTAGVALFARRVSTLSYRGASKRGAERKGGGIGRVHSREKDWFRPEKHAHVVACKCVRHYACIHR